MRATLPAIYGHGVDSVLAKMPVGTLAHQGDLLAELPTRGMHIPVNAAWEISLFPETRVSAGGPIVVRYHVSVVPGAR